MSANIESRAWRVGDLPGVTLSARVSGRTGFAALHGVQGPQIR